MFQEETVCGVNTDKYLQTLGENLQRYRKELKISQRELASRTNYPSLSSITRTISELERQQGNPRLKTVYSLAKGLEITVFELLTPNDDILTSISVLIEHYQVTTKTETLSKTEEHFPGRDLSLHILRYRRKTGCNQKEVASKLGRSSNELSYWESGRGYPSARDLCLLADILEVSLLELLTPKDTLTKMIASLAKKYQLRLPT